jgi:hypothetical protein
MTSPQRSGASAPVAKTSSSCGAASYEPSRKLSVNRAETQIRRGQPYPPAMDLLDVLSLAGRLWPRLVGAIVVSGLLFFPHAATSVFWPSHARRERR